MRAVAARRLPRRLPRVRSAHDHARSRVTKLTGRLRVVDFFTCSVGEMAVGASAGEPGIVLVGRAEVTRRAFAREVGTKPGLGRSPRLYCISYENDSLALR